MGVVVGIGVLVVCAVHGDPLDDGALGGHGAEDADDECHWAACFEGLVGEEAVVADGDAEPGEDVHHEEEGEVDPGESEGPDKHDRRTEADEWEDDEDEVDDAGQHGRVIGEVR